MNATIPPPNLFARGLTGRVNPDVDHDARFTPPHNLSRLFDDLLAVRMMPTSEDEVAATADAYAVTQELLVNASLSVDLDDRSIPFGCVTTDPEGGIRIEWFRPGARVHLVVRAIREQGGYIYHRDTEGYGTEPASADGLARWLKIISD